MLFQVESNVGVPAVNGSTRNVWVLRRSLAGWRESPELADTAAKVSTQCMVRNDRIPEVSLATIEIYDAPASDCGFPHRASDYSLLALAGSSIPKFRNRGDQSAVSARQHSQA